MQHEIIKFLEYDHNKIVFCYSKLFKKKKSTVYYNNCFLEVILNLHVGAYNSLCYVICDAIYDKSGLDCNLNFEIFRSEVFVFLLE